MKAIAYGNCRIHCDACGHEFDGVPPEWLNKQCPQCGATALISESDLAFWNETIAAVEALNALIGPIQAGTPTVVVDLYQDSAVMRAATSRDEPTCEWTEDADGNWETACGGLHVFEADGPAENHHRFCPYCGHRITIKGHDLDP